MKEDTLTLDNVNLNNFIRIMVENKMAESKTKARKLIEQGAVKVMPEKMQYVLKVGKRKFLRVLWNVED